VLDTLFFVKNGPATGTSQGKRASWQKKEQVAREVLKTMLFTRKNRLIGPVHAQGER